MYDRVRGFRLSPPAAASRLGKSRGGFSPLSNVESKIVSPMIDPFKVTYMQQVV